MSARPSVFTACLQVRDVLPADDAENRLGIAAQQSHTFALGGDRIVSGLRGSTRSGCVAAQPSNRFDRRQRPSAADGHGFSYSDKFTQQHQAMQSVAREARHERCFSTGAAEEPRMWLTTRRWRVLL